MHTTIDDYCTATGVCPTTAGRRLARVPYRVRLPENYGAALAAATDTCLNSAPRTGRRRSRVRGRRYYPLAAALMTLKAKEIEAGAVPALAQSARVLNEYLYIESESLSMAQAFAEWLPDARMRNRLRAAQNGFVVAVANSRLCASPVVRNIPPLRDLFALSPDVMRWVLAGGAPPDVDALAPAFAVVNNVATLDLHNINIQEAA